MRRKVLLAGGLALVVAAAGGVTAWRLLDDGPDTRLAGALALAPSDSARFSWTDWSGVRRELGADVDAGSPYSAVADFLGEAFERDLSSTSALVESSEALQRDFGFSPATIDWELFAQGDAGAALLVKLGAGTSADDVTDNLTRLGYDEADGVYANSSIEDPITAEVTPELAFVRVLDDGLLVSSDSRAGLDAGVESAEDGADDGPLPADVVEALGDPLSAALYTGDQVCRELAMSQADPTDQDQADDLLAAAGEVNPLTAFAIAAEPGGEVRVAMGLENEDQARTNADTRAQLASGPAPGQGGEFGERFVLGDVVADGDVVTMELEPVEGAYVLSDLSSGPVLFATC